ncbi:MAG: DUF1549 and DUF1553 domain-containing protein [Planctomycetaceae bacterium]
MTRRVALFLLCAGLCLGVTNDLPAELRVTPERVVLERPEAAQQLLVTGTSPDGRAVDLTRTVKFEIGDPRVAAIGKNGAVEPRGEGRTELLIRHNDELLRIPVEVQGLLHPPAISFEHEIIPLLTRAGCNAGSCHGKAEGQAGFKLSVFGSDAPTDYEALTREGRRRRMFSAAPVQSLFLQKATSQIPHGGGRKIEVGSLPYQRLLRWAAEGAGYAGRQAPLASMTIEPADRILFPGESQQVRVTAIDAEGRPRCVTAEAEFHSNADLIAHVDRDGLIHAGDVPGEAAILVRYMGASAVCRVTLPRPNVEFARPPEANFIDHLVWDKLKRLGIPPSPPAGDAEFARRVYLDTIGTLPTSDETRAFLLDNQPDKRQRLISQLLARDEYADYWAMRWSDLLRVDRDKISPAGSVAITRWLREQFARNRPYDEFVRDLITAQGDTFEVGPASFYKVLDSPEAMARSVSQLLLGVRIECAQCHHHPAEKWGQDDYYALAGFFTGVKGKGLPNGNQSIVSLGGSDLNHPRTGKPVPARALGAAPAMFAEGADRRQVLADWMTGPDNPYFARAIVNRLWSHYFGRGLFEPIDDLRATNPATNEPLLDALAQHLREVDYDLKAFTTTILTSRVYQLSSQSAPGNADDQQNFSHAIHKPLPAEVLLDAISQSTGVPEKFVGWPLGYRAVQIWDNRMPSYFFRIFGRPVRATVCQCERSDEPSIAQALHLMNSPEIQDKIQADSGRAAQLAASDRAPEVVIDDLMLATLSRFPTPAERSLFLAEFKLGDRRRAAEDLLWTLLNSKDFLYNH